MNMTEQSNPRRIRVVSAKPHPIQSYAELREQLHRDLVVQHPEWIESNGKSSILDGYDRRLAKLISFFEAASRESTRNRALAA